MDKDSYKAQSSRARLALRNVTTFWEKVSFFNEKALVDPQAIAALKTLLPEAWTGEAPTILFARSPLDALGVMDGWLRLKRWFDNAPSALWDAQGGLEDGYRRFLTDMARMRPYEEVDNAHPASTIGSRLFDNAEIMDVPIAFMADLERELRHRCAANRWKYVPHAFLPRIFWYKELAYHDFALQATDTDIPWFQAFKEFVGSGTYGLLYYADCFVLSPAPFSYGSEEMFPASGYLHNDRHAAVYFADGFGMCYFHGIRVPDKWILCPDRIVSEDLTQEPDMQKRSALVEMIGETRFAQLLDPVPIDEMAIGDIEISLRAAPDDTGYNEDLHFLEIRCRLSTEAYFRCVPPEASRDAKTALAWMLDPAKRRFNPYGHPQTRSIY